MEFIKGITFGFMTERGKLESPESFESLRLLKERTGATHIILAPVAVQDTAQSTEINWQGSETPSDEEIAATIHYAQSLDLSVILKPILNVSDGTWRAHINFFEYDVPCESKWSDWFVSYQKFICHYAKLAEETKCVMFVAGCELVNSDRREKQWRETIAAIRQNFSGPITYNCDKYQEEHVAWWDALDVISSSGYYPIDKWNQELDRIETTVKKFNKPFFFCEAGCMSVAGSENLPNDWHVGGVISEAAQDAWYQTMFQACDKRDWMDGYGLWDWKSHLYPLAESFKNKDYALYGKQAEKTVKNYFYAKG